MSLLVFKFFAYSLIQQTYEGTTKKKAEDIRTQHPLNSKAHELTSQLTKLMNSKTHKLMNSKTQKLKNSSTNKLINSSTQKLNS